MKIYKVTASYISYCHAEIEANSQEEAEAIARDMDGGEFIPAESDDWNIESVEEVNQ